MTDGQGPRDLGGPQPLYVECPLCGSEDVSLKDPTPGSITDAGCNACAERWKTYLPKGTK